MTTEIFVKENTWRARDFRIDFGWGNGYVIIPIGHHLHGKSYNEIDIYVHGGLTFSELVGDDLIEAWGMDEEHRGKWVVGFDTCHFNDTLKKWPKSSVEAEAQELKSQIDKVYSNTFNQ